MTSFSIESYLSSSSSDTKYNIFQKVFVHALLGAPPAPYHFISSNTEIFSSLPQKYIYITPVLILNKYKTQKISDKKCVSVSLAHWHLEWTSFFVRHTISFHNYSHNNTIISILYKTRLFVRVIIIFEITKIFIILVYAVSSYSN